MKLLGSGPYLLTTSYNFESELSYNDNIFTNIKIFSKEKHIPSSDKYFDPNDIFGMDRICGLFLYTLGKSESMMP